MSENCLFCRIVAGGVPADKVYEDDRVLAFHDIHPQAPVHVLVIPKVHFSTLNDLRTEDRAEAGYLLEKTAAVARLLNVHESGFRTIINTNAHGGQEVFHIHVHILGGRPMGPMVSRR